MVDFDVHVYIHYSTGQLLITQTPSPRPLLLTVEVLVKVPLEILRRVIESHLLVHLVNLLDILVFQLEVAFEVGLDPAFGLRFREDTSSATILSALH